MHSGKAATCSPLSATPSQADGLISAFLAAARPTSENSSLVTQETTVVPSFERIMRDKIGPPTKSECFTHSGWLATRKRVIASMFRTRQSDSRVQAFMSCGSAAWIERAKEDASRFRLRQNMCHDRLCQVCGGCRSRKISGILENMMEGKRCRFITLTLKGTKDAKLGEIIDRLMRSFRYLRSHPVWENAVDGGAAFLEIKRGDRSGFWHPHLHILCEGKYVRQSELSDAWRSITKDSFRVDIRDANRGMAHAYVSKYASKPLNPTFANNDEWLDEAINALRGRRLVTCFGTWYGTPLSSAEDEELADDIIDASGWNWFAQVDDLIEEAAKGNYESMNLIRAIPGMYERFVHATGNPPT